MAPANGTRRWRCWRKHRAPGASPWAPVVLRHQDLCQGMLEPEGNALCGPEAALGHRQTHHCHDGYRVSQRARKRIEEVFGWVKTVGCGRKLRYLRRPQTTHRHSATQFQHPVRRKRIMTAQARRQCASGPGLLRNSRGHRYGDKHAKSEDRGHLPCVMPRRVRRCVGCPPRPGTTGPVPAHESRRPNPPNG